MGRRRDAAQVARDRRRIADLYLRGWLQVDIAEEVGVDQSTVSRDLKALHQRWLDSALADYDAAKAQELAKVDRLEREYWQAWEASKQEKTSTATELITTKEGKRDKAQIKHEPRTGDPRYLAGVQWCIEKRCKILGIEAPGKWELTGKDGKPLLGPAIYLPVVPSEPEAITEGEDGGDLEAE